MSPRRGGESDKIGNRYEGSWTVGCLLDVLAGRLASVRVEPLGDLGRGVEFIVERADGCGEAHQVKRQVGNANEWSVAGLTKHGIWNTAQRHIEAGRDFHFVSMVPFRELQELADRTRDSNDYESFNLGGLPKDLGTLFTELGELYGGPGNAYYILRKFFVRLVDEALREDMNEAQAAALLEGGTGKQIRALLGELLDSNIDAVLTADRLIEVLRPYEIRRRLAGSRQSLAELARAATDSWIDVVSALLFQPVIPRAQVDQLRNLPSREERVHLLVGAAGGGKTAVLWQAVTGFLTDAVPTLVVRLDRYGHLSTTTDLGAQLGLDVSPVTALGAAAGDGPAVFVVDQLDAVSMASGRLPENFDVVATLVSEAAALPNLHVILGCRQFDVDNDHRIRSLTKRPGTRVVKVPPLDDQQVIDAVNALGLPAERLSQHQRALLSVPLHLTLLAAVADEPNTLAFVSSDRLFDAFWQRKLRAARARRSEVRFVQVVTRLASYISQRQELSVPASALDEDDLAADADVLVSEQLLVRDGPRIAFFHESFFDYAFARQWALRNETLVDFLIEGEQELFRRGQVRQIMAHLRTVEPARFVREVQAVLADQRIRFHIKDAVLTVLGGLSDPTAVEAEMLLQVGEDHQDLQSRLWARLCTPPWFHRFDAAGHIAAWLGSSEQEQNRGLNLMATVAKFAPDRLAELLAGRTHEAAFPQWLRRLAGLADLGSSQPLFELCLESIQAGHYQDADDELWFAVGDLANHKPTWAVEILAAWLTAQTADLELDEYGWVASFRNRDGQCAEVIRTAATGAPQEFLNGVLPILLKVMETTAHETDELGRRLDPHFSRRHPGFETDPDLDDALLASTAEAIKLLAGADPAELRPTLERLAADPHESAQWLLYQGLSANGATFADWAAELLLQGQHRLLSGYSSNGVWTTRQVLQAINPYLNDEQFSKLEARVRDLRFPWEQGGPSWYAFTLLSAMDEDRLSETGRRRLGELRRATRTEQPPEPQGSVCGFVGPPISSQAAPHMRDTDWLRAMARHSEDRHDLGSLTGGAREQAQVLKQQTVQDPTRFARFALQLTVDINLAYGNAILEGLGEAAPVENHDLVFDAVRHIASLGHDGHDRWLGTALQRYRETTPLDIVQLIRDRLITTSDPDDDGIRVWSIDTSGDQVPDIRSSGVNTTRGGLAEDLADLLLYDTDGARTQLAVPHLDRLAQDPSIPVRTCVARLIGAAMRHAAEAATRACWLLIDTDDSLLATEPVTRLLLFLGKTDPAQVLPVAARMLNSTNPKAREAGGCLATFAAMEWDSPGYLTSLLEGRDAAARSGAAEVAAHRLAHSSRPEIAETTLNTLMHDAHEDVREAAAKGAAALRDHRLRPFEETIKALIKSPTFQPALPQLLITLQHAPDRINDLALLCVERYVEVHGQEAWDMRTSAARHSHQIGELLIRGLAQSDSASERAELLDLLDQLLLVGAYGIDGLVTAAER